MCPVGGVVWRICVSLPPLGLLDFGPSPSHLPGAHLAPHSSCNSAWAPVSQSVSSVAQSCLTLCDPMDCSTPGLPVHHQLPEFTQTHVHWVTDASWVGILPRDFSRVHLRPGPVGQHCNACFWGPRGTTIFTLSCQRKRSSGLLFPKEQLHGWWTGGCRGSEGNFLTKGSFLVQHLALCTPKEVSTYSRDMVSSPPRGSLGEATLQGIVENRAGVKGWLTSGLWVLSPVTKTFWSSSHPVASLLLASGYERRGYTFHPSSYPSIHPASIHPSEGHLSILCISPIILHPLIFSVINHPSIIYWFSLSSLTLKTPCSKTHRLNDHSNSSIAVHSNGPYVLKAESVLDAVFVAFTEWSHLIYA